MKLFIKPKSWIYLVGYTSPQDVAMVIRAENKSIIKIKKCSVKVVYFIVY